MDLLRTVFQKQKYSQAVACLRNKVAIKARVEGMNMKRNENHVLQIPGAMVRALASPLRQMGANGETQGIVIGSYLGSNKVTPLRCWEDMEGQRQSRAASRR